MKPKIIACAILLAFGSSQAIAACPTSGRLTGNAISTTVSGNYGCALRGVGPAAEKWNELHQGTGIPGPDPVIDYKRGPGDPVDPTKQVGTFTIVGGTNPGTIKYDYGDPGGPYTYSVTPGGASGPPNVFAFCNVTTFEMFQVLVQPNPSPG